MSNRYQGEAYIEFADGKKEIRQTIVLAPYIQTSESLRDIDYDYALVVDAQTMEFDFKNQLYEMVNNQEALRCNTFLEYAHKSTFRDGSNVLQWLHEKNQIKRVRADEAYIVVGNGGNAKRFRIDEINKSIREQNEARLQDAAGSSYTDPSMNQTNIQPATIEGPRPEAQQNLTEAALNITPSEAVVSAAEAAPQAATQTDEIDLSTVPGLTLFDDDGNPITNTDGPVTQDTQAVQEPHGDAAPVVGESVPQVNGISREELEERFAKIETLLNRRSKDSVVTRMMNRYELTEAEAIKALETAGKRKERKKQKDEEKLSQDK